MKVATGAMLVGLAVGAMGQETKLEHVHLLTLVGRPLAVTVGQMRGTFAKYGVEVETENLASSDLMRKALAEGKGDVAYAAVDNAVAMVEMGAADVVIVSGGEGWQDELMAQPAIKTIEDLKGKSLLVDAVNTAYALQLKKILLLHGMRAGQDYEMNALGATPVRLAGLLANKEYAASMLPPPFSIKAARGGLMSLGSVPELIGAYQGSGHFVKRSWVLAHKKVLTNYLAAFIESQRWMMDPKNREQVTDLIAKESHLDPDVASQYYALSVTKPGGFEKDAELDAAGFAIVLKLRAEVEGQWGGHPPAAVKYYDDAYYVAALALAKGGS